MGRLLMLAQTPVAISVDKKRKASIYLKNGETIALVSDLRYFKDHAGKSFGLTGNDAAGKQWQFVFHKGQFASETDFAPVCVHLRLSAVSAHDFGCGGLT